MCKTPQLLSWHLRFSIDHILSPTAWSHDCAPPEGLKAPALKEQTEKRTNFPWSEGSYFPTPQLPLQVCSSGFRVKISSPQKQFPKPAQPRS